MNSLYKQYTEKGEFTIDFANLNYKCKGVLLIEVFPKKRLDTLILNGVESDLISHDNKFKIECSKPIVNGMLHFEPYNTDSNMQTVVRLLLEE